MSELNAISAIAYRDLIKFLRDPVRIISTLAFLFNVLIMSVAFLLFLSGGTWLFTRNERNR
jgi:hypothetical protein